MIDGKMERSDKAKKDSNARGRAVGGERREEREHWEG